MSEPAYRVDTEHVPTLEYPSIPWRAHIVRLIDDERVTTKHGATEEEAYENARSAIGALTDIAQGHSYYLDDLGQEIPGPFAVR